MQQLQQCALVDRELLQWLALDARHDAGNKSARLAHLDNGDQRAVRIEGGEDRLRSFNFCMGHSIGSDQRRWMHYPRRRPIASLLAGTLTHQEKEHYHASRGHRSRSDRHRNRYGQEHTSHDWPRSARRHRVAREGLTRTHYIEANGTCVYLIMPTSNTTCFQPLPECLVAQVCPAGYPLDFLDGAPNHPSQRFSFGLSSGRCAISHFPTISGCSSRRPMRFDGVILEDFLADFIAHLYRWRCLVFFALQLVIESTSAAHIMLPRARQRPGLESASVTAGTVPRPGISNRGAIAYRPSVTGERKVSVYAAVENSEFQARTNRLLRSISACALRPVRSIGRHERNRKVRH